MKPLYEYVCHLKGHRNSKGELAEWVIKSHETGEILSSHKSEKKAKEHLQQMHIFKEATDGFTSDSKSYKLLGESTYGTDMDKRVNIFMEGVSQLGLSANQVDAIGKLTKVCMESAFSEENEMSLSDDVTDNTFSFLDGYKFFEEAFKRAITELKDKYPYRLYEDKHPGMISVLVDKVTNKRFGIRIGKQSHDGIIFDPNCMIEVNTGSDEKTYPVCVDKSKSLDDLIKLIVDICSEELGEENAPIEGGEYGVNGYTVVHDDEDDEILRQDDNVIRQSDNALVPATKLQECLYNHGFTGDSWGKWTQEQFDQCYDEAHNANRQWYWRDMVEDSTAPRNKIGEELEF